jgi:hypothetical protein
MWINKCKSENMNKFMVKEFSKQAWVLKNQHKFFRAQVSLEMLMMIIFLFITMVPLIYYMYAIFAEQAWKVDIQQANAVINKIVEYSDKLAAGGEGSVWQISLYFPSKVKNITASGGMIALSMDVPNLGIIDQVAIAKEPIVLGGNPADWNDIGGMQLIKMNYSRGNITLYRS